MNYYANKKANGNLHYYKCADCLTVVTNLEYFNERHSDTRLHCSCGGYYRHMGQAGNKSRIYKTTIECACDSRCTSATGPKCSCSCNGANHGTGKVVEITRDKGTVPKVTVQDQKSLNMAVEFRTLRDFTLQAIHRHYGYTEDNGYPWLSRDVFDEKCEVDSLYRNAAFKAKSHKGRMIKFKKALEIMKVECPNTSVDSDAKIFTLELQ